MRIPGFMIVILAALLVAGASQDGSLSMYVDQVMYQLDRMGK